MDTLTLIFLCLFAFTAGFVDAIAGGGGLIQTPAALILLPNFPVASVIGTLKIPAFSGTALAVMQYLKKVIIHWRLISVMCVTAFLSAFAGSATLSALGNRFMKPMIFFILLMVTIYTFTKKDFGIQQKKIAVVNHPFVLALTISVVIGFYDGFVGPGAGSFLVLAFISLLGFDFLHASANAKLINLSTNLGSILLFLIKGSIIWGIAIPMAFSNGLGGLLGAQFAIAKGNKFIRTFFLIMVTATLLRFGYDLLFK